MGHFLFHKTLDFFKSEGIKDQKILVAVSGGLDSIVLLHVLRQLPGTLNLFGVYIHHGPSPNEELESYRKKAKAFVSDFCSSLSVPFLCPPLSKKLLKSEADMREFRQSQLKFLLKEKRASWLALAHNSEDLLETRLLHLIRGCGEEGLKSMERVNPPILRPFLPFSRKILADYAKQTKLKWLEDPSNSEEIFFRNWLRNHWLPQLEKKRPGSRDCLSRSLSQLASSLSQKEEDFSYLLSSEGLRRNLLEELPLSQKKRALAFYMRKKKIKNYSRAHIEEILKHLERKQKNFSLKMLKRDWKITTQFLFVEEDWDHCG